MRRQHDNEREQQHEAERHEQPRVRRLAPLPAVGRRLRDVDGDAPVEVFERVDARPRVAEREAVPLRERPLRRRPQHAHPRLVIADADPVRHADHLVGADGIGRRVVEELEPPRARLRPPRGIADGVVAVREAVVERPGEAVRVRVLALPERPLVAREQRGHAVYPRPVPRRVEGRPLRAAHDLPVRRAHRGDDLPPSTLTAERERA